MTYKDKKLKEFEDKHKSTWDIQGKGIVATVINFDEAKDFLSSTIDEIMACLPEKPNELADYFYAQGWDDFKGVFLTNLEQKAGEV